MKLGAAVIILSALLELAFVFGAIYGVSVPRSLPFHLSRMDPYHSSRSDRGGRGAKTNLASHHRPNSRKTPDKNGVLLWGFTSRSERVYG